ncbi:hypothetical protein [Streptomyces sp. NPDC053431]|uniref:hypothetical protein n=1 Tax=Streptomyces sp. NPDC053431 TaxID=3365703 RepID=UPI0037D35714
MSDGRGGPDVPRPADDAAAHVHESSTEASAADPLGADHASNVSPGTVPGTDGGFTDPTPAQDGIIVQGGRTAAGAHDSSQAIGPKQDDPRAIGPKQDDPRAIGPKQDDPRAIGPKQDDPRAIGPKQDDPRAIGPKQDDPRAIGPKQDDPRAVGEGIIVQGGRTGHPGTKARQKRARKKTKTMALVIGGVMVVAVGGAIAGRQLGQDPATTLPQAAAPTTASAAPAPSATAGGSSPAPAPSESAPATGADSPTPVASDPSPRGGGSASPARTAPATRSAQPPRSATPAPAAVPSLSLRPARVQEYCANGEWPNALVIRNSGGGSLKWAVGELPPGVTVSESGGSLAADASQEIALGGRTEQPPANGRFTIGFSSNGGSGQVTVDCA